MSVEYNFMALSFSVDELALYLSVCKVVAGLSGWSEPKAALAGFEKRTL
jgi:hypothetical protein